jgi:hypothetical protein
MRPTWLSSTPSRSGCDSLVGRWLPESVTPALIREFLAARDRNGRKEDVTREKAGLLCAVSSGIWCASGSWK